MNKKRSICIVVVVILAVAMLAGCTDPPLETISDKVTEIDIKIGISTMDIDFKDECGRSFSKLDDGTTTIKMKTYSVSCWSDYSELLDTKSKDIKAGEEFRDIDIPLRFPNAGHNITHKITIILPNSKIEYANKNFDFNKVYDNFAYSQGYKKGESDASYGYSAKIPWDTNEYYRDGYTDGYIGATPRYRYSPITLTIPVK